ncbi:hypothetical protein SDC9_204632 [bioreactor metagenome]|uniref:Uncharacterized protein n=1 Tax=bioreactor metagenome TaxID=1076179 RepID=A0A645J2J7_9ZZZZ
MHRFGALGVGAVFDLVEKRGRVFVFAKHFAIALVLLFRHGAHDSITFAGEACITGAAETAIAVFVLAFFVLAGTRRFVLAAVGGFVYRCRNA